MSSLKRTFLPLAPATLLAALAGCGGDGSNGVDASLIHTVKRDDIVITVRERGEIKAAQNTRISSQLEGRATLIYLIPEGTVVSTGEKVAELDVSSIVEKRAIQAIGVAKAEAALEQARKNVEIVGKELKAAERTAETRFAIAQLQLEKFIGQKADPGASGNDLDSSEPTNAGTNASMVARLRGLIEDGGTTLVAGSSTAHLEERVLEILGPEENLQREMGEMASQVLQQIDQIGFARADLNLADQTLFHSKRLASKGHMTTNELERDQIDYDRKLSAQTLAWNDLLLLVNYNLRESLLGLELEVENAELNLASVRGGSEARKVREDAELKSTAAEFSLAEAQLATWDRQIENGVLLAPGPGV